MKKLFLYMMMMAGMTACTNEDNIVQNQQPAAPQAPVYQVSIPATIGDGAATRAVELGTGDKAGWLVSTFRTTDHIAVYWGTTQATDDQNNPVCLHADADGKTANLIGTLTFYEQQANPDPESVDPIFIPQELPVDQYLRFVYNSKWGITFYTNQTGTFAGLDNYDFAIADDVKITAISGDENGYTLTTTDAHFKNTQSMYKFTFTGLPTGVGVKSVSISSAGNHLVNRYIPYSEYNDHTPITITLDDAAREANGADVVYAALRFDALAEGKRDNIAFTVTGTDEKTYIATKDSPEGGFQNGKYYTSTIEVYPQNVNLSTVTQTDGSGVKYYAAQNGQILIGKFSGDGGYITIADGATVTLAGADIIEPDYVSSPPYYACDHAAIHCLGNANIILEDKASGSGNEVYNRAKAGQFSDWPAVYVPQGKTLTISGTGKLWANGENSSGGAGIGGGKNINCGNITISSGIIPEAKGGTGAAGIGGGDNGSCGNILICGGTIGSYGAADYDGAGAVGGDNAPGIGNLIGNCGTITITDGITYVKVKKSSRAIYFIGGVRCGTVTISGQEMVSERLKSGDNGYIGNLFSICDGKQWELRP